MRWRGSSAEHVCWRRSAVRWAWGRTGPFRRAPVTTTPSPSEPGPSLYLRPLGRCSSGARGTTAVQANALEPSVNGLIDTTFGCYPSSKAADVVPKGAPTIWHTSTACHISPCCLLLPLKCYNFRPTGPFGTTLRAGCDMNGAVGPIPHCHWPSRTIYGTSRRVASCWARGSWDSSCSVMEMAVERLIFDRSDQQQKSNQPESYAPRQRSSAPLRHYYRHMGSAGGSYSAATSHMGIWHALALLMPLKCCNFASTRWSVWHHSSCWVRHEWGCRPYSALPLAVTSDIRHQPACGQLLGSRQLGLQLLSDGNGR
jgi:hypothetical protein